VTALSAPFGLRTSAIKVSLHMPHPVVCNTISKTASAPYIKRLFRSTRFIGN
jgi:hypothetical protein